MGRSRYKIYEEHYPYFITSGVVDSIALFKDPELVQLILDGLIFLQKKRGVEINAYVILENHFHLIAKGENLGKHIKNFKSFMAHQVIEVLKKKKDLLSLNKLRQAKRDHKTESQYQVWDEGFHPKQLFTYEMVAQKLDYIHFNPVKRGYVDQPSHWRYSSVRDYEGETGLIPITIFNG
ncbi:REP-associated tyrosine transposase [Gracilimonas sp.]|uniref:REP-associated tyrosine transposase n=1 Tax=Gracilimonas sp. TaxID=1974203 RepID=UPI0028725674|nr:transposase [Gracilimonas sp.]